MSDPEIVTAFESAIPSGSTVAEAQRDIQGMGLGGAPQLLYPAEGARPQVLLVRLYLGGGPWLSGVDDEIEWTDVSLVFQPDDHFDHAAVFRDSIRYFEGRPGYGPSRPPMRPVADWPTSIPPPANPMQGITEPLPPRPGFGLP